MFLNKTTKITVLKHSGITKDVVERMHKFKPIDDTADERSFGLVCFDDDLLPIGSTPVDKGEYLCATLRLDTRRVAPAVMKKYLRIALDREKEDLAVMGKKFITKERKMEIKEQVHLTLIAKALPVPSLTDIIFIPSKNEIWLCSTNAKIIDIACELIQAVTGEWPILWSLDAGEDAPVDEYAGKKLITWAFYASDAGLLDGWIPGKSIALQGADGKVSVVDPHLQFLEAKEAMIDGKLATRAAFGISIEDADFQAVIQDTLQLTIKTPKVIYDGDDLDGAFFEKVYMVERVLGEIKGVVAQFQGLDEFSTDNEIRAWANNGRSV